MTERRERPVARRLRLGCALLLLCGACGDREAPRPAAAAVTQAGGVAVTTAGDTVAVQPYRSPAAFPLAFHTVLPENFTASEEMDGRGAAIRFTRAPGGEQRDSSFVYLRVMDEGTTEGAAREIVRTAAERVRIPGNRTELQPRDGHRWAVVEYPPSAASGPSASR